MAKKMSYDATTGEWVSTDAPPESNSSDISNKPTTTTNQVTSDNKDSSQSIAEEEYNEIDYYNLQGSLNYIATPQTLKIKAGDTIEIKGIGKYLSGKFYVLSVSRKVDSGGYSHTAEVIRPNFGVTVKYNTDKGGSNSSTNANKEESKPKEVQPVAPARTYTVVRGDCLWSIARKFYGGTGAKYTVIYNANKGLIGPDPNVLYPGWVLTIP